MIQALASLARRVFVHPASHAGRPAFSTQPSSPLPRPGAGAPSVSEFARFLGDLRDATPRRPAERPERRAHPQESPAALPTPTGSPMLPLSAPLPSGGGAPPGDQPTEAPAGLALQQLWPALVRRVAWEGDARRASMRLELGAGALAGVALLLQCDEGRVQVRLSAPAGAGDDLDAWRARIAARLARAGLAVESVD